MPVFSNRIHPLFPPGTRVGQFTDGILAGRGDDSPCDHGRSDSQSLEVDPSIIGVCIVCWGCATRGREYAAVSPGSLQVYPPFELEVLFEQRPRWMRRPRQSQ